MNVGWGLLPLMLQRAPVLQRGQWRWRARPPVVLPSEAVVLFVSSKEAVYCRRSRHLKQGPIGASLCLFAFCCAAGARSSSSPSSCVAFVKIKIFKSKRNCLPEWNKTPKEHNHKQKSICLLKKLDRLWKNVFFHDSGLRSGLAEDQFQSKNLNQRTSDPSYLKSLKELTVFMQELAMKLAVLWWVI